MEKIEGFHLFTCRNELDGLTCDSLYRECSTASGVAVKFGEDNSVIINGFVEGEGGSYRILACHCIHYEEAFAGLDRFVHGTDFIHQFLVHA